MGPIRQFSIAAMALCLNVVLAHTAFAARPAAESAMGQGPYAIETAEYKFPAAIDPEVLPGTATELWARVYWPRDLTGNHPIVFFLHGNHPTCGTGSNPRSDWDCQYTLEGTCPDGQVVVPNHEGYNYLGEYFASHGFIAVSINANRGITCNSGDESDSGLNLARGRLVLRHLEQWQLWSTIGGAPSSLGISDRAFVGHIDLKRVGLMGHSRGGEGVRAALNLFRDQGSAWPTRIPDLDIKAIYEIGAVDGQTSRTLDADNVAWNQLLPMCDGDVADLQGRMPFERMLLKQKETRRTPKSLSMAWGTNHNFFNTEWQENDAWGCNGHDPIYGHGWSSEAQKNIAINSMGAFFRAHLNGETALANQFDPSFVIPQSLRSITRVDRDHVFSYDLDLDSRIDDFDQPTGLSSARVPNEAMGVDVSHETTKLPRLARVSWNKRGGFLQVNWTKAGEGRNASAMTYLDFRVTRQGTHMGNSSLTDFSVQLVDASGKLSAKIPVSQFAEITGPASLITVLQTVRIPLGAFAPFNLASVRGIRFTFDLSPKGALYFANVRLSSNGLLPVQPAQPATPRLTRLDLKTRLDSFMTDAWSAQPAPGELSLASAPAPQEFTAELLGVRKLARSRYFRAASGSNNAVEIAVRSDRKFPVQDSLPTLVLSGKYFKFSKFGGSGKTDTLIFTVLKRDLDELPEQGTMHIQYGSAAPSKVWRLPDYEKSKLVR